jgi:hypothetical protein
MTVQSGPVMFDYLVYRIVEDSKWNISVAIKKMSIYFFDF